MKAKTIALALALTAVGSAATQLGLSGTAVKPNIPATLQLNLTGSSGTSLAALQWTLALPTGLTPTITAGAASTAAGKSINCNQTGASVTCIASGMNANLYADGVVALIQFTPTSSGALTFTLSGTLGATAAGNGATVGATTGPFVYTVLSNCDVNGDGSTNVVDVTAAIAQALGTATCNTDLDGDGQCTVIDVTRVVNAALGGACLVTTISGSLTQPFIRAVGCASGLCTVEWSRAVEANLDINIVGDDGLLPPAGSPARVATPAGTSSTTFAASTGLVPAAWVTKGDPYHRDQWDTGVAWVRLALPH